VRYPHYMKLVIVESPSKAKTIEKYLGSEYTVRASVGHIRDLPKSNKDAVDVSNGFKPTYVISSGKDSVISELHRYASKADEVLLATDPDREGEAIAWHLAEVLGLSNAQRIVFHEITEGAIKEAIKHPRPIDTHLREAQEARRVLDRLVGYDLSGIIWKKVRYGLSAGRVQSPALRIIMEREREIRAFIPVDYWVITGLFKTKAGPTIEMSCAEEPTTAAESARIVRAGASSAWCVESVEEKAVKRSARAPFTTSTLQQTASTRLGFSPSRTMQIAQKLYEQGAISYMRTDSTNLSKDALGMLATTVKKEFGEKYLETKTFASKSKNAQEAHEAIRPTETSKKSAGATDEQKKLYALIRARALASQMTDAETMRTTITAQASDSSIPVFKAHGSRVTFDGWLAADPAARGEDVELPKVVQGEQLKPETITDEHKQTQPPGRYTEAGLIKELEKRGIGRPSTYASIMKTLADREYVLKDGKTLKPTDTGDVVSSFLEQHFAQYISDDFTAGLEDQLDDLANGNEQYAVLLERFYTPFLKDLKSKDDIPKQTSLGDAPEEFLCPVCEGSMEYKLAKNGKFMSCKKFPECAGARKEDGTELEPPKGTGEDCPKCGKGELQMREGRFGMFVACSKYPKCKYIKKDAIPPTTTGIQCPLCQTGEMAERRGRFGIFYSCTNYPDCKNAIKTKPTGNLCPLCQSLMMEGSKTIPERCSIKTCPMHNPHKLAKSAALSAGE
jgi:DNA topoisomerase I